MKLIFVILCLFFSSTNLFAEFINVNAQKETASRSIKGDSLDDPAIWIHPTEPGKSLIFGTDKQMGLVAYTLDGKEYLSIPGEEFDNIDIRYGFRLQDREIDIVAVSSKADNSFYIFGFDYEQRKLTVLNKTINRGLKTYGICLYRDISSDSYYAIVTGKEGKAEKYLIKSHGQEIKTKLVRTFNIATTNEGCVADDEYGAIYIAEEAKGIWRYQVNREDFAHAKLVVDVASNPAFAPDVEGLSIYYGPEGKGYLLASMQGNDSFAVFDRKDLTYLFSFKVSTSSEGIDEVTHTDGIDVIPIWLSDEMPFGMVVVQDDENEIVDGEKTQNFKMIGWHEIVKSASSLNLIAGSTWNARDIKRRR